MLDLLSSDHIKRPRRFIKGTLTTEVSNLKVLNDILHNPLIFKKYSNPGKDTVCPSSLNFILLVCNTPSLVV